MIAISFLRRVKMITLAAAFVSAMIFTFFIGQVVKAQSTCTDSDGGSNYFVKGTAEESVSPLMDYTDQCGPGSSAIPQGHELIEWNCDDNGRVINEYYNCPNGCQDGACVEESEEEETPECTDSDDGKDYFVQGEVTDLGDTREDNCFGANTVTEFFCDNQPRPTIGAEQKKCEYGCQEGACLEEPSEEELARIEKEKQIEKMLAGISSVDGLLSGVKTMEKAFRQLAMQKIIMPAELKEAIARVQEISPEITQFKDKKASDFSDEEAETLLNNLTELNEISSLLTEWGNQVPKLFLLSAQMKQIPKDLTKAKRDVSAAGKLASKSKFGISDKKEELNEAVKSLKTTLNDARASIDFDEKEGKINEFYDEFQGIYATIGLINNLQKVQKGKEDWSKKVKENTSTINKLKRAKFDTAELVLKKDEIKVKLDELNIVLVKKPFDRDEVKWLFEDLKSLQAEFIDIADQLSGVNSALPQVHAKKFNTSSFKNFAAFNQFYETLQESNEEEELPETEE